jgi:hypothetical protein
MRGETSRLRSNQAYVPLQRGAFKMMYFFGLSVGGGGFR